MTEWPLTDQHREDVEQELAHARDELWARMQAGPENVSRDGLYRWRQDLHVRRKEIARLERLLD